MEQILEDTPLTVHQRQQHTSNLAELMTTSVRETTAQPNFNGGIFGDKSNFNRRFIEDYSILEKVVDVLKQTGHRIVLTSGTFDIIHIGHTRYLESARNYGDFLVVGVDDDDKTKQKKGAHRPVVSEQERLQMLGHVRGVGLLTLKRLTHPKWELIKVVKPDTLIATEGTYSQDEVNKLENNWCGEVVVLPPQATTSTTARIRKMQIDFGSELGDELMQAIKDTIKSHLKR